MVTGVHGWSGSWEVNWNQRQPRAMVRVLTEVSSQKMKTKGPGQRVGEVRSDEGKAGSIKAAGPGDLGSNQWPTACCSDSFPLLLGSLYSPVRMLSVQPISSSGHGFCEAVGL